LELNSCISRHLFIHTPRIFFFISLSLTRYWLWLLLKVCFIALLSDFKKQKPVKSWHNILPHLRKTVQAELGDRKQHSLGRHLLFTSSNSYLPFNCKKTTNCLLSPKQCTSEFKSRPLAYIVTVFILQWQS
jgi:hypothetical protein